jgi:hypothetical protein
VTSRRRRVRTLTVPSTETIAPTIPFDFRRPTVRQTGHLARAGQHRGERRKNHKTDLLRASATRPVASHPSQRWLPVGRATQFDPFRTESSCPGPTEVTGSFLWRPFWHCGARNRIQPRYALLPTTLTPYPTHRAIAMITGQSSAGATGARGRDPVRGRKVHPGLDWRAMWFVAAGARQSWLGDWVSLRLAEKGGLP